MTPTINRPIIHDVGDTLAGLGPGSELRPQSEEIDVTVVIPMRNEEANVASLCAELQEVTDKELLRYEVIIVNDGSTDGTPQRWRWPLKMIRDSPLWNSTAGSANPLRSPPGSVWRGAILSCRWTAICKTILAISQG